MSKRNMQVILRQEVQGLGQKGQMVGVKPGYARNFLFPNGIAVRVTPGLLKEQEMRKAQEKARLETVKAQAQSYKTALDTIGRFVLKQKVGEEDLLFGSVTNADIAQVILSTSGLDIDRRNISFEGEINKTGVYPIKIKLHPEVTAEIRIQVSPE